MTLTQDLLDHALALGFSIAGVVQVATPRHAAEFTDWLAAGFHGEMTYLANRAAKRVDPLLFAPDAQSMILVAATYAANNTHNREEGVALHSDWPTGRVEECASSVARGRIARYASGPDYHDTIKPKLFALDAFIRGRTGRELPGKVFVDTAPVLERDLAEQSGLGFIGRNCCLITPGLGSWTVLAGVLAPEKLEDGNFKLEAGGARCTANPGCGRCTRCLDACPTRAFVAQHVLDARRCISYLTIELRGPIPRDLRSALGNWVFGCDVCQEVCPYNKQANAGQAWHSERVGPDPAVTTLDLRRISLSELLTLDDAGFRTRFRGTPVLRAKRRGLVRNACVAAGNAGDPALVPTLISLLTDAEPLIRGHAAWALGQIGGEEALRALDTAAGVDPDPWVREEIAFSGSTLASIPAGSVGAR